MRTTRRTALATAGIAAAAGLVLPPSQALAAPPACPQVAGQPGTVVAVTGVDRGVHYRCQGSPYNVFNALGGIATSAPSVVTTATNVYFMVSGRDHALYIRTTTLNWARASDPGTYCIQPAMALQNATTLVVACTGSNGQLYTSTNTFTDGQLPRITGFRTLGGVVDGGPGLAVVGGVVQHYVTGSNHRVYMNTGTGYALTGAMACVDTPAVSVAGSTVFLGCHGEAADDAIYARNTSGGDPTGWGPVTSLGGQIQRVPAIVATEDSAGNAVALYFYAMGTNDRLYEQQVPLAGGAGSFVGDGGLLRRGVGAAQLQPTT